LVRNINKKFLFIFLIQLLVTFTAFLSQSPRRVFYI